MSAPDPQPPAPPPVGQPEPGEPEGDPEQGFIRELSQFFVVPSLIVLLCVGVFIMFGLVTSERSTARDFLQQVRSESGSERWQAAFELSRLIARQPSLKGDDRLVGEITAILEEQKTGDPKVRKYLVIALEHLANPSAGPILVASLEDPDPEVRLQSARALSVIPNVDGAVDGLARLLQDDDTAVRKVAVYALGQTRDPKAKEVLLPRLEDSLEDIRWNAALALAVLGDPSGAEVIGQMLDRKHLDGIEGITEDQKVSAIVNGVQAVYLLKDRSFEGRLRDLSQNDPSLKVREIAMKALESISGG
ncbi:MAG TPA: HEAT repeat domain-containing protein [Candidatus Polarisedimenticolia bacterium]|nr:HEAT repeat domain-containing protein [Candidatus Polarisedimenticolia bacterium]